MVKFNIGDFGHVVSNKFEAVILVSQRARDINAGSKTLLQNKKEDDKDTVVALNELFNGCLDLPELRKLVIRRNNLNVTEFGYSPELDNGASQGQAVKPGAIRDEAEDIFFGGDDIEN